MKILHINTVAKLSTGNIASDIIREVDRHGGEGVLVYSRGDSHADIRSIQMGNMRDVYAHVILTRITDRTAFYSKKATRELVEIICKEAPDLIHLHNVHGYYVNIEILFAFLKEYNKPVVWTMHDCWPMTGHCPYFTTADCNRWLTECHDCPQKKEYPNSYVMDQSRRNYVDKKRIFTSLENVTLVTPSKWMQSMVEQSFLKKYPVKTIYNGVDPEIFYPRATDTFRRKYGLEGKKIILGVAAVWSERKGYDDFVKLSKLVDDDTKIVMVGLLPKQIKQLPSEILGLTRTQNAQELAEIYSEADWYFNASVEETMGLTTVEANMCGTPAVVYNATAVPECVQEGNGYVVEARDVEAVYKVIQKNSFNVQKESINPLFYRHASCERYYELYQEILEKL